MRSAPLTLDDVAALSALAHQAAQRLGRDALQPLVVLSGAGISVESGIPDFRSRGGLWSVFDPEIYASLETFYRAPELSWEMFRALGRTLQGKQPNAAHRTLAALEAAGLPVTIVTQNVDGLHQAAGSSRVLEIHGDHYSVQCLACGYRGPLDATLLAPEPAVPACPACGYPLKPNMVLFGEDVRHLDEIQAAVEACAVMLVIGTSASVYPAAALPTAAAGHGALLISFNLHALGLHEASPAHASPSPWTLVQGPAGLTVPAFCQHLCRHYGSQSLSSGPAPGA